MSFPVLLGLCAVVTAGAAFNGTMGPQGPTGAQGPTGLQGATGPSVVSAFSSINGGIIPLTNTFTLISGTTITTTSSGYIVGQCGVQVVNTGADDHIVEFYLLVNGSQSNTTNEDIRKQTGGVPGYANLTILHRCPVIGPGTHVLQLWGRYATGSPVPGTLVVDHVDVIGLGNLS